MTLVALAGWFGAPGESAASESSTGLLQQAREARRAAEMELATARERRRSERKRLAGELQQDYRALDAAREEAKKARQALRLLQAKAAGAEGKARQIERQIQGMVSRAATLANSKVDWTSSTGELERAIRESIQQRLEGIQRNFEVRREKVIGRNGQELELPVLLLGGYASYAAGDRRDTCGLLLTMVDGRRRITGPYLDPGQIHSLREALEGTPTHLPLDVSGALRDRPPVEPGNLWTWLEAGGLFVYPIIIVGFLGWILILERLIYLSVMQTPPSLTKSLLSCLERKDPAAAREILGAPRTPGERVLLAGLEAAGKSQGQREAAMESALLAEVPRLERSLSLMGALAGVAPLLGLLGTVSGMITTFNTIAATGTGNPRLLSGGISEALITTQLGLMVAIPLLLAHAWLSRWVERREAQLEYDAIQVFGIEQRGEKS